MFFRAMAAAVVFALLVPTAFAAPEIALHDDDRILVLAPHPDDETLGCGGVLQEAVRLKIPVRVVFMTYGDSNQWSFIAWNKRPTVRPSSAKAMGNRRRAEALAALDRLGVPAAAVTFLGYPDYGTLAMWLSRWNDRPPVHGRITRATSVPYDTAYRPGAPYKADELLADVQAIIHDFRPTQVFVSHPADHHPDHEALYLFTRVALWNLTGELSPAIHPFLVHFPKWPLPKGYRAEEQLEPPAQLRAPVDWSRFPLDAGAVEVKKEAIQQHKTQYHYSAKRLLPFVRPNENFGDFPSVKLVRGGSAEFVDFESEPDEGISIGDAPPEVLAQAARDFVSIEGATLGRDNGRLTVEIPLDRPLPDETQAAVYLFGYRRDKPFPAMPKLSVRFTPNATYISDNGRKLAPGPVIVIRQAARIRVSLPLSLLGSPEKLLVGARTWADPYALDILPWRIVDLP